MEIKQINPNQEKELSLAVLLAIQDKKALIFTARKGYASGLMCKDCGYVLKCQNCEAPLSYYLKEPLPYLLCRHCLRQYLPPNKCPNCSGFDFKYFGLASQKLKAQIEAKLRDAKVLVIDKDNVKTNQELLDKFSQIEKEKNIIVIATELALKPQMPKFDIAVISLLEELLSFPDYSVLEKAFRLVRFLDSKAKELLIQTFDEKNKYLNLIILPAGREKEFFEKELQARKEFNLPPFASLIKIKLKDKNLIRGEAQIKELAKKLNHIEARYKIGLEILGPTFAFIPKIKDFWIFEIIVKYDKNTLGLVKRNKILSLIDTSKFSIDIDPITLI